MKLVRPNILAPMPDTVFDKGEMIVFCGRGFSPNHETTRFDDMVWSSRLDGYFGVGYELAVSTLRAGRHYIRLSVPDGFGGEATAGIFIEVRATD